MFCEECGVELEPGVRFCENCGTPVPESEFVENNKEELDCNKQDSTLGKTLFLYENWAEKWETVLGEKTSETGIIITKSGKLINQLNCGRAELDSLISDYISFSSSRGVNYFYLDLDENKVSYNSDNSVDNVVSIISQIAEIGIPKYLFILGNEDTISYIKWNNESSDHDENVPSDFAYTVLSVESPWEGMKYDFDSAIRVGRLPVWKGESFDTFSIYFKNAKSSIGKINKIYPYALSALVWKNETQDAYSAYASGIVDTSPDVTRYNVDSRIPNESNLFLFNLHGSDNTKYWYGQEGGEFPEAFSPGNIAKLYSPNFIGVEACYGAIFEDNRSNVDSNVMAALTNKTVALLGSSRIAYGTSNPPGSCADIVIGEFVKQIANGLTAGDAHICGLKKLCSSSMDDSDIKTLCEFALYGDPSACTGLNKSISKTSNRFGGPRKLAVSKNEFGRIRVSQPDIRRAIKLSLAQVSSKISDAINIHVYENYEDMKGVEPKTFIDENTKIYQSIFENSKNAVVKVYFDSHGKIKKEIHSK